MNHYHSTIESIEALLGLCIKLADRVGNDEIRISKTRAREILLDIRKTKKNIEKSKSKHIRLRREPAWLDNPF